MDTTFAPTASTTAGPAAVGPAIDQPVEFVDRRTGGVGFGRERRQFTNSHSDLSPEAAELAGAIDAYKLRHRRRFINFEEMITVLQSLGYSK